MQNWERYGRLLDKVGLTWETSRIGWGYIAFVHAYGRGTYSLGAGYAWTRYRAMRKAYRHYLMVTEKRP